MEANCCSLKVFLTVKPHAWRALFSKANDALRLNDLHFRPYSLRRGGATFWFNQHGSFDRLLAQGRWAAARAARVYLNDGLAQLADISPSNSFLLPYVNLYCRSPSLEPGTPQGHARSGGRGGRAKKGKWSFVFHDFAQARKNFSEWRNPRNHPLKTGVSPGRFPSPKYLSLGGIGFGGCSPIGGTGGLSVPVGLARGLRVGAPRG